MKMTEIGSVYCAICWDYYNRVIYANKDKLACKVLAEFLYQRRSGTGGNPLSTAELRHKVRHSGKLFCSVCFSIDVTLVAAENQTFIKANVPVNGLNLNSES